MLYQPIHYTHLTDFHSELRRLKFKGTIYINWLMTTQRVDNDKPSANHRLFAVVRAIHGGLLHTYTGPISEYTGLVISSLDTPEDRQQKIETNQQNYSAHANMAEQIVGGLLADKSNNFVKVRGVVQLPFEDVILGEAIKPPSQNEDNG